MNHVNLTTITGLVHHLTGKKDAKYFPFSIRHDNTWTDGTARKDFLNARAAKPELQETLKTLTENAPVRVKGSLRTSKGSGELFLAVTEIEPLAELPAQPENSAELSGNVHFVKAQQEGENATGRYIRFAVKQVEQDANGHINRDFLVVRVYDDEQKKILAALKDGDPVYVHGTMRSSRGSGVNYIRCVKIGQ